MATKTQTASQTRSSQVASRRSDRMTKKVRSQLRTARFIGAVDVIMIGLSLSHLAHGVELVTNCSPAEAWAMATGIDLTFTGLEVGKITCSTDYLRRQVSRWANPTIAGTMAGSAIMNALAFSAQADGLIMKTFAVAFGVALPVLIFNTTQVATKMWMGR